MYQPWALSPNTADSVYCSVSNLLTGCRSKSCSPGVILCQIACCYFCGKMCFTVSPNVNMLKMVITCHRRTWWLVVLVRKAVPDKSDTSTQPVCTFVVCCALSHNGFDIHRLPCGCASNFNVPIRCIWRHIQFPLYWNPFSCCWEKSNQLCVW